MQIKSGLVPSKIKCSRTQGYSRINFFLLIIIFLELSSVAKVHLKITKAIKSASKVNTQYKPFRIILLYQESKKVKRLHHNVPSVRIYLLLQSVLAVLVFAKDNVQLRQHYKNKYNRVYKSKCFQTSKNTLLKTSQLINVYE